MKRLLRTAGMVFLAVIVLVAVKNEYGRLLMSNASYGLQALLHRAEESKETGGDTAYDLYLGSSMFRQGLDISALEELSRARGENREAYILSYNGAQPFLIEKEVEYLLAQEVPIASVTVDLFVNSVQRDPWVEDTRLFLDTDLSFKLDLWQEMRKSDGASPADLWEMLVTSNNDKLLSWYADYPLVNAMFRNGGNLVENTGASAAVLDGQLGTTERNADVHYTMNERQTAYLQRLIDLCLSRGIELCFVETPKYRTAVCEQAYVEVLDAYCQFLESNMVEYYLSEPSVRALETYPGTKTRIREDHVVEFDNTDPACYIDVIHLSSEGRRMFTSAYVETVLR